MAQIRDIESLKRTERYVLAGLVAALILFLVYASTSIAIPPPIKGLKPPTHVYQDQASVRTYYTLDGCSQAMWSDLDLRLQIYGFKRQGLSFFWNYRNANGDRVTLMPGAWRPATTPEGAVDTHVPGKTTLVHMVRTESWKMLWTRFLWQRKMRKAAKARVVRSP